MVKKAKQNGFPCEENDIVDFKLEYRYDVIIALFHVISYITDNASLIKVFQNAANHLNEEGLFIFDVWYSPAVYNQKPEARIKRLMNDNVEVIRIAEPEILSSENVVNVNYQMIIPINSLAS